MVSKSATHYYSNKFVPKKQYDFHFHFDSDLVLPALFDGMPFRDHTIPLFLMVHNETLLWNDVILSGGVRVGLLHSCTWYSYSRLFLCPRRLLNVVLYLVTSTFKFPLTS